ncbi:MAG: transglutaminase domain-containing protein [Actinobacteria bacterium]|nr:transglutaminase domain-containing protein [Actinomycetota bacterium]
MSGAMRRGETVIVVASLAAATSLAGFSFVSAFQGAELVPAVVGAGGGSVIITWFLVARASAPAGEPHDVHLGPSRAAFCALVELLAFAGAAMLATRSASLLTIGDGLRNGWATILSSAVPADADGPAVVVPLATTWLAGALGTIALVSSRSVVLPLAPSLVLLGLGGAFGGAGRGPGQLALVALVVSFVLVVRLGPLPGERNGAPRRLTAKTAAVLGAIVLVVATVPVALLPAMPGVSDRNPVTLRDYYEPPTLTQAAVDPLSVVTAAQRDAAVAEAAGRAPSTAFVVGTDSPVDRFQLAALDSYDGERWTSTARFLYAGHELATPGDAAARRTVQQRLRLLSVPGYWIPSASRPSALSSPGLLTDPASGMLATPQATADGIELDVEAAVPVYSADQLRDATLPAGPESSRYLDVPPGVSESIRQVAQRATAGADRPLQQAFQIQQYLKQNLQSLPRAAAIPGHSLRRLADLLTEPDRRQGSPEQFAAAFALLARLSGLPSRVVVGYRVAPATGEQTITQGELTAWPEVLFDGFGWLPFDPDPVAAGQQAPAQAATTDSVPAGVAEVIEEAATDNGQTDASSEGPQSGGTGDASSDDEPSPLPRLVGGLAVLVVAVLAALAGGSWWARRRRRQIRRHSGDERSRVLGAWDDTLDRLAETGVDVRGSLSATTVASHGIDVLADADVPLVGLATLNNRAGFAPDPPSENDVQVAWDYAARIAATCSATRSARQRARSALDPRAAAHRSRRGARSRT